MVQSTAVAYFSMEIGIESGLPTYSGGLGILAGDTVTSAASLRVPMVAVTLLHRKGYFYQKLDERGWQTEAPVEWAIDDYLTELPERVSVIIEGRTVSLRAWQFLITGLSGFPVPVIFLDSDLPENSEWDRTLTDYLYGGDAHYRLCQEVILGFGGVRMLRALGYDSIDRFHMNEGHASLLVLELLNEELAATGNQTAGQDNIDKVHRKCVFTTHTPVRAGHDQFPSDLADKILGPQIRPELREQVFFEGSLNMTHLALNFSHYINGVAKRHGEISRHMFAGYVIDSITNGINVVRWTSSAFAKLFDRYIPGWREDNYSLRYAISVPGEEVWKAHITAKRQLIEYVNHETNAGLDVDILTIGFARRAALYKRADLVFRDPDRLKKISTAVGPLQFVFAGKAHPQDQGGKELIKRIFAAKETLKPQVKVGYLDNYDIGLAQLMTAGSDIWLNTPIPPREASGTSGMKAAINGVPSFSVLDGWWIEGCIDGVTGWAIGELGRTGDTAADDSKDIESLYTKLEHVILPLFYNDRNGFIDVMRSAIALNGSFFNTQRMMQQYVLKAYFE
jgi:starch phosphorylase